MTLFGAPIIERELVERYFWVRDAEGRHCIAYKSKDENELSLSSSIYTEMDFVIGLNAFVVKDFLTEAYGIIDLKSKKLLPCLFQAIVIDSERITIIDFNNDADYINIEEDTNDALISYSQSLNLEDVFLMGKNAELSKVKYYRSEICSEEKKWGTEGDVE